MSRGVRCPRCGQYEYMDFTGNAPRHQCDGALVGLPNPGLVKIDPDTYRKLEKAAKEGWPKCGDCGGTGKQDLGNGPVPCAICEGVGFLPKTR